MASSQLYLSLSLLFLAAVCTFHHQVHAEEQVLKFKLDADILQESIVRHVNEHPQAGWKATMNPRFSNYSVSQFKYLLGVKQTPEKDLKSTPVLSHPKSLRLPKSFDAREAWPQCISIGTILDQGHCGSCWAFGAVESLSDRFCIHFDMNITLSVNDLLACCGFMCGDGCDGGYPISAWRYFVRHGVVTEQCDPYFDTTGCSHPGCEPAYPTPRCVRHCVDKNQIWRKTKHYGVNAYRIKKDPNDIMAEVYKNGPVEVSFTVYEYNSKVLRCFTPTKIEDRGEEKPIHRVKTEAILVEYWQVHGTRIHYMALRQQFDFLETLGIKVEPKDFAHYKSGVYKYITGDVMGGHAVKLIGWGTTDDGEDYWLLANQWNRGWGEDGYFKIRRGTNECGIEEDVVAGLPSTRNIAREAAI